MYVSNINGSIEFLSNIYKIHLTLTRLSKNLWKLWKHKQTYDKKKFIWKFLHVSNSIIFKKCKNQLTHANLTN